jgi:hypothetical protein
MDYQEFVSGLVSRRRETPDGYLDLILSCLGCFCILEGAKGHSDHTILFLHIRWLLFLVGG